MSIKKVQQLKEKQEELSVIKDVLEETENKNKTLKRELFLIKEQKELNNE